MTKLVGYFKFTSKAGKACCKANVTEVYSDRDKERGCIGLAVKEIYLPESQVDLFTPADIGKELKLEHDIVGRSAYLRSVTVVK